MAARSGPADVLPQPASTRKKHVSGDADLNPSSPPAENHKSKEAADIPKSGSEHFVVKSEDAQAKTEEKGGVHMQGEKRVSLRSEEVNTEETKTESKPEFNQVQQSAGITEKMPTSDLKTVVEETLHSHSEKTPALSKIPQVKSNPESRTKERAPLEPQAKTAKTSNLKSVSWTERTVTTEDASVIQPIPNLESISGPGGEPGQHMESNTKDENTSQGSSKTPDLQLNPDHSGLRGEIRLDVGESKRKEEKRPESEEKRKEVKVGGKKSSLR